MIQMNLNSNKRNIFLHTERRKNHRGFDQSLKENTISRFEIQMKIFSSVCGLKVFYQFILQLHIPEPVFSPGVL